MPNHAPPDGDPPELREASAWLTRHGLTDERPTPLLAARLAVRRRARIADSIILAVLIVAAALAQVAGGFQPNRPMPLIVLTVAMAGLLLAQSLLYWWVRRVDRRAGASLSRRAAHPLQPGWRALIGRANAVFTAATFAGATALAVSALLTQDSTVWYAALVMLVGLAGVAAGLVLQLRDLLTRPVVAEDEASLMADVVMRIEDSRELTRPTVTWSLPMVLVFGSAPDWWNAAALAFVLLGLLALVLIQAKTPPIATVARQAMGAR